MFRIEKMKPEHIKSVAQIEKECFPLPWSEQSLSYEIYNPDAFYIVIIENDEVIGYGGYLTIIDEAHIMDIAVKKSEQGKGYGNEILFFLIESAKEQGLTAMTLEVRESNIIAQKLYEKYDFVSVGIRPKYYENKENAVIYWLTIREDNNDSQSYSYRKREY